jgi:integrase
MNEPNERSLRAKKPRGLGRIFQPTYRDKTGRRRSVSVWWIAYNRYGTEHRERAGTKSQATALLKQRHTEIKGQTWIGRDRERVTLKQLIDGLRAEYQRQGRRSLKRAAEPAFKALLEYFGDDRPARTIEPRHLSDYVAARLAEGRAAATCRNELALLRRAFRLAYKRQEGPAPPADFPMPVVENARQGFIEWGEFQKVLTFLRPDLRDLALFAYLTAWRRGECLTVTWADVDREGRTIRLRPEHSKTGHCPTLALEGELLNLIERRWTARRITMSSGEVKLMDLVFHRHGRPIRSFRGAWAKACERAGVPGRLFHDLRRSAVRNMIRGGVPERVAMAISGHKTRAIFDRYNITSEKDVREAVLRTEAYLTSQPAQSIVRKLNE